ncbi:hypothetical protein ES703_00019 [subsurface metagenome]
MSQTDTYTVVVGKIPTVMSVSTAPPPTVDARAFFNFDGNLREEVGLAGIVGRDIELYINGSPTGDRTRTTTDGYWIYPMSLPKTGTYSVQAKFDGDGTHEGSQTDTYTVVVGKMTTRMVVTTPPPASVAAGESIHFGGYLEDVNGSRLAGKETQLLIDGGGVAMITTDANGNWEYVFIPPGTCSMYVMFAGDDAYEGCDANVEDPLV